MPFGKCLKLQSLICVLICKWKDNKFCTTEFDFTSVFVYNFIEYFDNLVYTQTEKNLSIFVTYKFRQFQKINFNKFKRTVFNSQLHITDCSNIWIWNIWRLIGTNFAFQEIEALYSYKIHQKYRKFYNSSKNL